MKVSNIRSNFARQADLHVVGEMSVELGLSGPEFIGHTRMSIRSFIWIQVLTTGWDKGSRNRTKNFSSYAAVYAYINKLHIGGWLSDEDYHSAYTLVLALEYQHEDVEDQGV